MTEQLLATFEEALRSKRPVLSLREAVRLRLDDEHVPHGQVQDELRELLGRLQAEERSDDEDVVLDVMDFLSGFSSPHMSLAEGVSHVPTPVVGRQPIVPTKSSGRSARPHVNPSSKPRAGWLIHALDVLRHLLFEPGPTMPRR
jgi:hypothetical protein